MENCLWIAFDEAQAKWAVDNYVLNAGQKPEQPHDPPPESELINIGRLQGFWLYPDGKINWVIAHQSPVAVTAGEDKWSDFSFSYSGTLAEGEPGLE